MSRWHVTSCLLLLLAMKPAAATWSIAVIDADSQETVLAAATCVANFDLLRETAVVRAGVGGGIAQAAVDVSGARRLLIDQGLRNGQSSSDIVTALINLGAGSAQHGVVGAGAGAATQTGAQTLRDALGVAGQIGNLHYAIQGNLLASPSVVTLAETSLRSSNGALIERVQLAMEAARAAGGDARCSCTSWNSTTGCVNPIPNFPKAAHIGYLLAARAGDGDDPECTTSGCADGSYYLKLNIANQSTTAVDPVLQLRAQLDTTLQTLVNVPDAVATSVGFARVGSSYLLSIHPRDHRGVVVRQPPQLTVQALPGSQFTPDTVIRRSDGRIQVWLQGTANGVERHPFRVELNDNGRVVLLPPRRTVLMTGVFADGFELAADGLFGN